MSTIAAEYERTDIGTIQIAPEVIEVIAGLATIEVDGVAGMSGGFAGGIVELLGRKNLSKGVKVEVGQREAAVDVNIIVEYGNPYSRDCFGNSAQCETFYRDDDGTPRC